MFDVSIRPTNTERMTVYTRLPLVPATGDRLTVVDAQGRGRTFVIHGEAQIMATHNGDSDDPDIEVFLTGLEDPS